MLTKSGTKLLDFGLARITHTDSAPLMSALTALPTEDGNITGIGAILGTLQYMAPEQLQGQEADARTDIFAFGTVLYEMATGHRAFRGKSQASLIADILSSEPAPLLQLSPMSPPMLDRVVRTCLEKDPDERWQTAHDVRLQLQWIRDAGSQAGIPRLKAQHRITRERTAWAAAIFLLLALAATLATHYVQPALPPARKIMFAVEPVAGYKLPPDGPSALSPDGTAIAYAAQDSKGKKSLWVHTFDSMLSTRLEGSETGADYYSFVWAPDGRAVIASVDGKLLRLSTAGGANEVLCDKFEAAPSSINREGTILAWTPPPTQVFSVSPEDCTLRPRSPSQAEGVGYAYAHFLPDGHHFLFAAVRKDRHHDILLGSLSDLKSRVVVRNGSDPRYVDTGYILFSRDGYLMAQKFDGRSQSSSGESFLVFSNQLAFYAAFGWAAFDASRNGFISVKEQYEPPRVLRWYSRSGQVLQTIGDSEYRTAARLTRQGTQAAVALFDPRTHVGDVWSVDLEHGTRRRETFHDRPGGWWSAWSSDAKRIVYSVLVGNELEIFIKNTGSSGNGQMLQTGLSGTKLIGDVSPDGYSLVYLFEDSEMSIYGQAVTGGKPFRLARAGTEEEAPRFSPDGHWVVYQSSESGSSEIYVRTFTAEAAPSVQASVGGGHDPRWSRDGKELFYRTNDGSIVGVPILDLKQHRFGKPVMLFRLVEGAEYDTVDGKRFLVNEPAGAISSPLVVIANWKPEPVKNDLSSRP
jgi:eukaryotic-like serine/threonine-protein kinase